MSFFLAGMSFLVAALATMLALERRLVVPIYAVIFLGFALSFLFTVASCLSGQLINERQFYVRRIERELGPHGPLNGPNIDIESGSHPKGRIGGFLDCCMHGHPASISLIVPEIFVSFWAAMIVYSAIPGSFRWLLTLVTGIVILVVLFGLIHEIWHPWYNKG
jgi:hypothetical protein